MSAIHGVWVSSILGAVLFGFAGYLVARFRAAPAADEGALRRLQGELRAAAEKEQRLTEELATARSAPGAMRAELEAELQRAREAQSAAEKERSGAIAEVSALKAELQKLRGQHTALVAAELEKARRAQRTSEEITAPVRASLETTQREREAARKEATEAAAKLDAALRARDAAQQRIAELEERLADGESADTAVRADPRLLVDLERRLDQAEVEAHARTTEANRLRASLEQLQAERKELLAKLAAASKAAPQPMKTEKLPAAPRLDPTKLQGEVERLQQALLNAKSEREAALARAKELDAEAQRLRKGGSTTLMGIQDPAADAERAKRELRQAQEEVARLKAEVQRGTEAGKEAERLRAEILAGKRELEVAQQKASGAQDQIASLKDELRAARQATGDRGSLESELLEQRARLASVDGKLAQVERLEEERFQLKQRVKELEGLEAKLHELESAEGSRKDLAIKVGVLEEQLATLESLREENLRLRGDAKEVGELRRELARLTAELAGLRSQGLHREAPPQAAAPLPPGTLGGTLQSLLAEVAKDGRTRGVVVADESGLVVASTGANAEALAAAAAVFVDSATRVLRNVLPLGPLRNLAVVDENDVTIAALPLTVSEHALILATLSAGPGPDPAAVRALARR